MLEPSNGSSEVTAAPRREIALERFAELTAELELGEVRDGLLAREGLSLGAWQAAQEAWLSRMADEALRNRRELTTRYTRAFLGKRRQLAIPAGAAVAPGAPAHAPPPRSVAPAAIPVPAPISASPPPAAMQPPAFAAQPAPAPPLEPPAIQPPPPPAIQPPPVVKKKSASTVAFTLPPSATQPAALPFVQTAPGDVQEASSAVLPPGAASALTPSRPRVTKIDLGTTQGVGEIVRVPALPFAQSQPSPPGPAIAPKKLNLRATLGVGVIVKRPALPFAQGSATKPPTALQPNRKGGLPFQQPASGGPHAPSEHPLPLAAALPARAPSSVPPAPGTPPEARLTLEQMASLAAEIAAAPSSVQAVLSRYGLDEAGYESELAAWKRRFAATKGLFDRFTKAYEDYATWLRTAPR